MSRQVYIQRSEAVRQPNTLNSSPVSPFCFPLVQVVWPALAEEFGWTKVYGPRMHDVYYLPMGIVRGQNGARCRVDYYDSNRQARVEGLPRVVSFRREHNLRRSRRTAVKCCPVW